MQISKKASGGVIDMTLSGRLDNESSGHLTTAIDDAVRLGSHTVTLDLTNVTYISSAGIGALVKAYKQLQSIRGFFGVVATSPEVDEVIRLTGLGKMLLTDRPRLRGSTNGLTDTMQAPFRVAAQAGLTYEVYDLSPESTLTCEVIGDPSPMSRDVFPAGQCQRVAYPAATIGLGLGAFGESFADCTDRFGEFLSVGGAVAQQPTNSSGKPDFQRVIGEFVPSVQMLYGLKCAGDFSQLIRFDRMSTEGRLKLSLMAEHFLNLTNTNLAAMVMVAESAGLIGASLRRSPASEKGAAPPSRLTHPEIRRWLSFTPEQAYSHSLALVAGVVSRGIPAGSSEPLAPLLRPLSSKTDLQGHFHAAVFSYRPFKKRKLELTDTVSALFENEDLQAVLHLLHDDREITGGGESEFVGGACWVGPIASVTKASVNEKGL